MVVGMKLRSKIPSVIIAASFLAPPAFAKDGEGPKQSFFGASPSSSPFTINENREDSIYSPYSPYGDGAAAAYNTRKGGKEEIQFWQKQFSECKNRVAKIPGFVSKKTWSDIPSTMTTYAYNMREAMLWLAKASTNSADATEAAKAYFTDLNDIAEYAVKKNGDNVMNAYQRSLNDLSVFEALLD